MSNLNWIEEAEATGRVEEIYRNWRDANPDRESVPEIFKCFSLRPDLLKFIVDVSYSVHFSDGFLTRRVKEMIATLVSGLNQCPY